jgi:hypothetical protein
MDRTGRRRVLSAMYMIEILALAGYWVGMAVVPGIPSFIVPDEASLRPIVAFVAVDACLVVLAVAGMTVARRGNLSQRIADLHAGIALAATAWTVAAFAGDQVTGVALVSMLALLAWAAAIAVLSSSGEAG